MDNHFHVRATFLCHWLSFSPLKPQEASVARGERHTICSRSLILDFEARVNGLRHGPRDA